MVVDRNLHTGRNPFSPKKLAVRIVADVTGTAARARHTREDRAWHAAWHETRATDDVEEHR